MANEALVLEIVPIRGAQSLRLPLTKRITSVGSDPDADVRLPTAPAHWAVVHRGESDAEILVVSTGARHRIAVGQSLEADGITVTLDSMTSHREHERAIDELFSALAAADSAERGVEMLLTGIVAAAGADLGALILDDGEGYHVAAARDRNGKVLDNSEELLSDTIVRDVLGSGQRVQLDDLAAHSRYAGQPSVAAMRLRSAVCLPMRLEGKTLGAVFVARHDRTVYDERTIAELRVLSALAVPFIAQLRRAARPITSDELVGESEAFHKLRGLIKRIGPTDLSALLHGPSGSGKEVVARAIHAASARSQRPIIAINCASVASTLLDAELFGYRKGAFTGAVTDRVGLIEASQGSTLFLDEIGDMPLPMQAALLRVLEQREVKRLGENTARAVDFRLVCATHRDLEEEVAQGRFRADLLFRLREVTIEIPALASRGDDIELLAYTFMRQTEKQLGLVTHTLTDDALQALRSHTWPGNIRELKATVRRAAILADSKLVRAADLGLAKRGEPAVDATRAPPRTALHEVLDAALAADPIRPLAQVRDEIVRQYVLAVIERCDGDRDAAAKVLEIGVRSLYRYIA